jgi:hypothetical protein
MAGPDYHLLTTIAVPTDAVNVQPGGAFTARAFTESDALLIFLLKARDPQRFARKLIAVGGDGMSPISIEVDERVHFFMPSNGRDRPEALEGDESPTIEGTPSEDDAA